MVGADRSQAGKNGAGARAPAHDRSRVMMRGGAAVALKITKVRCNQCHESWVPRVEAPAKCPRCGSYHWNRKKAAAKPAKAGGVS